MKGPNEAPRWLPLPFLAIGTYLVLLSLGVLPYAPHPTKRGILDGPQHWQITCIGIAFAGAGLSLLLAKRNRWIGVLLALITLPAFVAPIVWLLYFSGKLGLAEQILASVPMVLGVTGAVLGLIQTIRGK